MEDTADKTRQLSELQEAFASFNSVSGELEASYRRLQARVESLQRQLAAARRERADEARRLTAVLEALPGGVVMIDESGIVRRINSAAIDLLGDPLQDTAWQSVCRRAFHRQASERGDLTLSDGRQVSLAQKDMAPEPGRVLLLTDVTENRKFQELLDRHRRLAAMGEMAAALAHQIRTPLSAALLYTSNAARTDLSPEHRGELLDKATTCMTDLEQLIGDMLQFARGAGDAGMNFTLADVLSAVERSLRPTLDPDQTLCIDCTDADAGLSGNREAVVGAVLNLANNALQAAGDAASVRIRARVAGAHAEIVVSDNGPGVPPEQAHRIFDPFYTSRPDGTGLGLAVVKSVAESHGGDVTLVEAAANGASFVLRLATDAASRPAAPAGRRQPVAEEAAA
jgi:two-component system sensor histidine kinase FlrB